MWHDNVRISPDRDGKLVDLCRPLLTTIKVQDSESTRDCGISPRTQNTQGKEIKPSDKVSSNAIAKSIKLQKMIVINNGLIAMGPFGVVDMTCTQLESNHTLTDCTVQIIILQGKALLRFGL
jgi:hypothetical protein